MKHRECKNCGSSKYYCKGLCKSCYTKQLVPSRWSRESDFCKACKSSDSPHVAHGLCQRCFNTEKDAGNLCECGCGLPTSKRRGKETRFRKGHWVRTQGSESEFQKSMSRRFSGEGNPQFGKFGKDHPAYGNKNSPEVREMLRKRILKTMSEGKFGKTDIEIILSEILDEMGVYHVPQTLLYDKFTVDEYLPKEGIVIEANGAYWHGDKRKFKRLNKFQYANTKRDKSKIKWLTDRGHFVLVLWEKELKTSREWCKNEIILAIQNSPLPLTQNLI